MKKVILLVAILIAGLALAGERDTHGGGAIVCRSSEGNVIQSVELLDLWEGRTFSQYQYPNYTGDVDSQLKQIFRQMSMYVDFTFLLKLKAYTSKIKNEATYIDNPEIAINPPSDAKNDFIKKGCKLEGFGIFKDEPGQFGKLWVDKSLYQSIDSALPNFLIAALFIHEAIYKIMRDETSVMNSVLTRKITANLLSLNAQERYFTGKTYACTDMHGDNSFYIMDMWTEGHPYDETRIHLINNYSETVSFNIFQNLTENLDHYSCYPDRFTFQMPGRPATAKTLFHPIGEICRSDRTMSFWAEEYRELRDEDLDPDKVPQDRDLMRSPKAIHCSERTPGINLPDHAR